MNKQTAQQQIDLIASAVNKRPVEIRQLVMQANIDDENFIKRIIESKQQQIQDMQLNLLKIELHNRSMEEVLLQRKLNRRMWWWGKIDSFTKIFKKNEPGKGSPKN